MVTTPAELAFLLQAIDSTPIIDNHAHPLLKLDAASKHSLLSIATEAHGDALDASPTSLAHLRAVKQLSSLLGCDESWDAVNAALQAKRANDKYQAWVARCLSGIECVLVDDGLDNETDAEPFDYFDTFTPSPSKRIVRIEKLAAQIIDRYTTLPGMRVLEKTEGVMRDFEKQISDLINDEAVVGFKSVICYRTGLAIPEDYYPGDVREALGDIFYRLDLTEPGSFTRVSHRGLSEYLVLRVAQLIRDSDTAIKKPIQFHTGLGDNDITLNKSSPSHLQLFIKTYPTVPIVLLHSGYPFVRETGYLAAMYANVYADIGEVFPLVSRDGQETIVRQILELCPASKILWSTDGHWFPETYVLAVNQMREAFKTVLSEYVSKGDFSTKQAVSIVEDILFNNSNKLYQLRLSFERINPQRARNQLPTLEDSSRLLSFMQDKVGPKFLGIWWNDMTAAPRMRSIPIRRAWSMLKDGQELSFGLAEAYHRGLLLNETLAPGVTATGEWRLHPDLSTLRPGPRQGHVVAMANLCEEDGTPAQLCPRSLLRRVLDTAADRGLTIELGFEMELVFVERKGSEYHLLGAPGHNASSVRAMEHSIMEVVEDAINQLEAGGVFIDMVHAESAKGQFEIILSKAPALQAVDNLLYARDVVSYCAAAKGYRMTLHPKPIPNGCGTASHVHMSISSSGGSDPSVYEPFYAGILNHLRAINAFTYSHEASYERAVDSSWAGGTWVTWGSQNRETPLRKIKNSHWELKCMDGLANPYLALSSVIAAGVDGVANQEKLIWGDCSTDPALLSPTERDKLNIVARLPRNLSDALKALEDDEDLRRLLGESLVKGYIAVKRAEQQFLGEMEQSAVRTWIMDRF